MMMMIAMMIVLRLLMQKMTTIRMMMVVIMLNCNYAQSMMMTIAMIATMIVFCYSLTSMPFFFQLQTTIKKKALNWISYKWGT